MVKKDKFKIFTDETFSRPPKRNYPSNKIIYNDIDEIWSNDLADLVDYKTSNNKGYRYMLIVIDNFSKYLWAKPLKNKKSKTITDEFSKNLSSSKRSPVKIENNRGSELYNSTFQNFLKSKNFQH